MSARVDRIAKNAPAECDAAILERIANGEIGALGELYDRHRESVRRFVSQATSGAEDVDDLVHATFLEAAKSAGKYDGRESSRAWLVGIAVHLLRRRRRSLAQFFTVLSASSARSRSVDPRTALEARTDIERALARISEAKRIAILLAEVEGLTCEEIATALGVPIGTVWTRLHAARAELRAALAEEAR